jgi:hypothetical protein
LVMFRPEDASENIRTVWLQRTMEPVVNNVPTVKRPLPANESAGQKD